LQLQRSGLVAAGTVQGQEGLNAVPGLNHGRGLIS
jgi:hypothetical protein